MNLTENFTLEEMIASSTADILGIDNTPNDEELSNLKNLCEKILQPIRNNYGRVVRVNSGYRCRELNRAIHGCEASQHLKGEAADITAHDNQLLWDMICEMILKGEIKVGQLIDEKHLKWIHVSLPTSRHFNQIIHM